MLICVALLFFHQFPQSAAAQIRTRRELLLFGKTLRRLADAAPVDAGGRHDRAPSRQQRQASDSEFEQFTCHGNQDTISTTSLDAHHAHPDYGLPSHDRSMPRPVSPWRYLVVTALLRHPAFRLSPVTYR